MELQVIKLSQPIIEVNIGELKSELSLQLDRYKGVVYDDDAIAQAKKDRAFLNKLKDAIDTKRKEIKKEVEKPLKDFDASIKELTSLIDEVNAEIDAQAKAYDEKKRQEKLDEVKAYWAKSKYHFIDFTLVQKASWSNLSESLTKAKADIDLIIANIDKDLSMLSAIPNFTEAHRKHYYATLNYATIVEELNRINTPPTEQKTIVDEAKASFVNAPSLFDGFPSVPLDRPEVIDKNRVIEFVIVSRNEFDYEMIETFCKRNKLEWRNK